MATVEELGLQIAVPSRTLYIENLNEILGRRLPDGERAPASNRHDGETDVR